LLPLTFALDTVIMKRRNFLKAGSIASAAGLLPFSNTTNAAGLPTTTNDRKDWVKLLTKIAYPVLKTMSEGKLKELMPVEAAAGEEEGRKKVTYLEALGRTMAGIAPWLELGAGDDAEAKQRMQFIQLAVNAVEAAVQPGHLNFTQNYQPLVDAAFLAQALLRAPKQLWGNLNQSAKEQLVQALESTRVIKPFENNWLLFSAMIEAALYQFTGSYNDQPVDYALQQHEKWYKGDGVYGDGLMLANDYYNSFVIQPMMLDIVQTIPKYAANKSLYLPRAQRYAEVLERLISPEGSFPPIGRSIAYRCGAFHLLSQLALQDALPTSLPPAQVRSALTAVIKRSMQAPGAFDANGWLTIGFCGHQPGVGESYISTGSLYLCTLAFLPLGLPASHAFWKEPAMEWTSVKAYSGKAFPIDHAYKEQH